LPPRSDRANRRSLRGGLLFDPVVEALATNTCLNLLRTATRRPQMAIPLPPLPAVWEGRACAAEFLAEVVFRLVPEARFVQTRANRQPALAVYTRDEVSGLWHGTGLLVITVRGDQVAGLTRFESHTLRAFGLPRLR